MWQEHVLANFKKMAVISAKISFDISQAYSRIANSC